NWSLNFLTTSAAVVLFGSGSGQYPGVPVALQAPDDVHRLLTSRLSGGSVGVTPYFKAPIDIDDASLLAAAGATVVTGTKTQVTWQPYPVSSSGVRIAGLIISLSTGWLGQATSYTYPRLCDVPGYPLSCVDATTDTNLTFDAIQSVGAVHATT